MGTKAAVKWATLRFIEFTGLAFLVFLTMSLAPLVGKTMFVTVGSELQETFFPTLAPMRVLAIDPTTLQPVYKTMPAFEILTQKWVGNDLLVMKGIMCKAEDYKFEDAKVAFGSPDGVFQPADVIFQKRAGRRLTGCQTFENWLLVGANMATDKKWFLVLRHRPSHDLWDVRQTLGPFSFPERSSEPAG